MGSSPVTSPTQNLGMEVRGMMAANAIVNAMARALPLVGPTTEVGMAFTEAIKAIGKHLKPGSGSPQGDKQFFQQGMMDQAKMAAQRAALQRMAGGPMPTITPPPQGAEPPGGGAPSPGG